MKKMTPQEAKVECERWLACLDRDREKSLEIQAIAAQRRAGKMTEEEARRSIRRIDGLAPKVYDASHLEEAVRLLIKNIK